TISLVSEDPSFTVTEWTIVGLADSPLYISPDRGSTSLGDGTLKGFVYLPGDAYSVDAAITDLYLTLDTDAALYSVDHDDLIAEMKQTVTDAGIIAANNRYAALLQEMGVTADLAARFGFSEPEMYVLTRGENIGYVRFKNDAAIVSGLANLFPFFFVIVAMLVCITTMTRMVDEERTQMGVLKAMGYGDSAVMGKYILYAASATLIGWALGFFLGTWLIPQVFWLAYSISYGFAPLGYLFSDDLALGTLIVALVGTLGSTLLSCKKETASVPARLIQLRAPRAGKRILLERIRPLWKRLSFLQKITLRNMFLYKKRMWMMLVGIGGCTALLVTAFGVRDSMLDIGRLQYEVVQQYDLDVTLSPDCTEDDLTALTELPFVQSSLYAQVQRMELLKESGMQSVQVMRFRESEIAEFFHLVDREIPLAFPESGEVLISRQSADRLGITSGDTVELRSTDMLSLTARVAGVFDNYMDNYVIVSNATAEEAFDVWLPTTLLLHIDGDVQEAADVLRMLSSVSSVTVLAESKRSLDESLSCLNLIVLLIIVFAGALAFVVIYNLTNINLVERSREIATVNVLGFYPQETNRYILQENIVLSVLAGLIGLPYGKLFHQLVMGMIVVDGMGFDIHIAPVSFGLAFICTILFALIVNLYMRRRIARIPMAESLKTVD
ncbi:MAG: ABC transporter permease, partial [Clostridia bacterium]|nr:ABC transporter permease [Clostridia bacterium]